MTPYLTGLLSGAALVLPCAAYAQANAPLPQAPEADPSSNSAEIIVTAQRRSQRLEEVPMSITALSGDTLKKAGVSNTADLSRVTPGLVMASYSNNLQPSIRGVSGTGANTGDNPSVAIYLDGVYQAQQVAGLMDLPDVEQVEVLKGPQGTLYGQNATGGAIIIKTRDPSKTLIGRLSASYGNRDALDLNGFVSGPLVGDVLAVSVAGSYQKRDGFLRHVITGERDAGLESKLLRGKILFQPTEKAKIIVTGYYGDRSDSSGFAVSPLNDNSAGYAAIPDAPRVTSSRQFGANPDIFNRVRAQGASGRGEFDLDVGTLSAIVAYAKTKVTALNDLDGGPVNLAEYHWEALKTRSFVTEATFASRKFGSVSFILGGLYLNTRDCFCNGRYVQRDPNLPPEPISAPTFQVLGTGIVEKKNLAVYAEATVELTDNLVLTVGGRYSHERQEGFAGQVSAVDPTEPVPVPYADNPVKASNFSPRITARYEFAQGNNVYASYTGGFKGGLINTSNLAQPAVRPEKIKAYEVGYKGKPAPDVSVGLSAFLYDYTNLQVVSFINANTYITQNAASARGKGFEFSLGWAATPEFTLSSGVAYLDAKYRDYKNAQSFTSTGTGNVAVLIPDRSGDRMIRAPKWSGNVSADYEADVGAGKIGANASLFFTTRYLVDPLGLIGQQGFVTVNGELSFAPDAVPGLRLSVWGKNLTDKAYLAQGQVNDFSTQISWADRRTFGVRAEYRF